MKQDKPDTHIIIENDISDKLDIEDVKEVVMDQLSDDKAEDIEFFAVNSDIISYAVIASGRSSKHISAMTEKLVDRIKDEYSGIQNVHVEGEPNAQWILVDIGEVMVHLFTYEMRQYYNLEEIYENQKRIS
jgi:ribosome-associated protein